MLSSLINIRKRTKRAGCERKKKLGANVAYLINAYVAPSVCDSFGLFSDVIRSSISGEGSLGREETRSRLGPSSRDNLRYNS